MMLRIAKIALVLAVALFYSLVVFNNLTDYDSNYQFVRHVLMMDTTFPGNHGLWRALNAPAWHTVFYLSIIGWEALTMILCWWGGLRLAKTFRSPAARVPPSQARGDCGANPGSADVACGLPECGRRVVSDVAVKNLERPGSRLPHVHRPRHRVAAGRTTRYGRTALASCAGLAFCALRPLTRNHNNPAARYAR